MRNFTTSECSTEKVLLGFIYLEFQNLEKIRIFFPGHLYSFQIQGNSKIDISSFEKLSDFSENDLLCPIISVYKKALKTN